MNDQRAVGMLRECESAFVYRAMMASAQQHEVLEAGATAINPVDNMMGVAAPSGAARKPATCVACEQRATNRRGNRARLPSHIEHRAVRVVMHHDHRRITRQTPGRFRENVRRPIGEFECAIEWTWLGISGDVEGDIDQLRVAARSAFRWGRIILRPTPLDMEHDLIPVSCRASVQVRTQGGLSQ